MDVNQENVDTEVDELMKPGIIITSLLGLVCCTMNVRAQQRADVSVRFENPLVIVRYDWPPKGNIT